MIARLPGCPRHRSAARRCVAAVLLPWLAWGGLAAIAPGSAAAQTEDPVRVVERALAEAREIQPGAEALVRLAWPPAGEGDEAVAAAARQRLVEFGHDALPALRAAVRKVAPEDQPDVVSTLIQARWLVARGSPPDYLPALEEAIWFGNREARLVAIPELGRWTYPPALLTMLDAATEDPALRPVTIRALAMMRNDRARFFLAERLHDDDSEVRVAAAEALAAIGGQALAPLREGLLSDKREVRLACARALLPVVTLEDLSALYEYYGAHADDDAETLARVREAAQRLELLLQQQRAAEAASPLSDQ